MSGKYDNVGPFERADLGALRSEDRTDRTDPGAGAVGQGCVEWAEEQRARAGYQAYVRALKDQDMSAPEWGEMPESYRMAMVAFANHVANLGKGVPK